MAKLIMKIAITVGSVIFRRIVEKERTITVIRLTWIPGIKPVIIPAEMPNIIARMISISIKDVVC